MYAPSNILLVLSYTLVVIYFARLTLTYATPQFKHCFLVL